MNLFLGFCRFFMVRIWRVPVSELNRQHLLGEHAELHCIVGSLLGKYKAYRHHPETLRFEGRLDQLYARHIEQVAEMQKRGYKHDHFASNHQQILIH
jgi:hypothetical protein